MKCLPPAREDEEFSPDRSFPFCGDLLRAFLAASRHERVRNIRLGPPNPKVTLLHEALSPPQTFDPGNNSVIVVKWMSVALPSAPGMAADLCTMAKRWKMIAGSK